MHAWAAAGRNLESDIYFDTLYTNSKGSMSGEVYIKQTVEPAVEPQVDRGDDFVIEEDRDSRHGSAAKGSKLWIWKEKKWLRETLRRTTSCPDEAPIERGCQFPE